MNEREHINTVLDEIVEKIMNITDTVETNPENFFNRKIYVRYSEVISIIDEYRKGDKE